jgi:hypothetical protein
MIAVAPSPVQEFMVQCTLQPCMLNQPECFTPDAMLGPLAALTGWRLAYGNRSPAGCVERRRREPVIRMAIGASPRHVAVSVLKRSLPMTLCGVAAGIPLAMASTSLYRTLLFGVAQHDRLVVAAAATAIAFLATAAACGPAWRAARTEPWAVLRGD